MRLSGLVPEAQTVCYTWVFMSNCILLRNGFGGIAHLAKRLDMMQPAVSYAVIRGELIAKGRNYNSVT